MKKLYSPFFLRTAFVVLLMLSFVRGWGQVSLSNITNSNTQNFDGMLATTTLPANWRMHASTSGPTWAAASLSVTQQSSGSPIPVAGGTYNWGTTTSERAVGAMTSGGFASPNNLLSFYVNDGTSNITQLTISYNAERYRINSADASIQFYYSLNGTSWTAINTGDIAKTSFPTGTSSYTFASPLTVNKTGITISSLSIAPNSTFYLRWNINTTGGNSQGIGIDNVSVNATFAATCTPPTPTWVTAPSTFSCAEIDEFYETQSGKSNYVWTIPGIAGTDYTIVSGGNSTSNTLTIRWLKGGSKTVTVGYTEGGCASTTPASYNSTVSGVTISPTATQNIFAGDPGTQLTAADVGSAATSREWKYSTIAGGPYVSFSPAITNTLTYTPQFAAPNTYYVICESTFACGAVTSNAVQINVTALPKPVISSSPTKNTTYGVTSTSYQITASNSPTSYAITSPSTLPSGFTYDAPTRNLSVADNTDAGVYTFTLTATNASGTSDPFTLTWTIAKKTVTVTGITVSKIYDQTTTATLNLGAATINTLLGTDAGQVSVSNIGYTANYNNKNVGTGKAITLSGLSLTGTRAANYTLTQPTLTGTITKRDITVSGITANNKVYDGTTSATFDTSAVVANAIYSGDVVTFAVTGAFADANAGTGKIVNVSAVTLGGIDGGNYNVTPLPTGLTANITRATPLISPASILLGLGETKNLTTLVTSTNTTSSLGFSVTAGNGVVDLPTSTTIHALGLGNTPLRVIQAADMNYEAVDVQIPVTVEEDAAIDGDYRTVGDLTTTYLWNVNDNWQIKTSTGWSATTYPISGTTATIWIKNKISLNIGTSTFKNIIVTETGEMTQSGTGGMTILSGGKLLIKNKGTFINTTVTKFASPTLSTFEIEDGGNFINLYDSKPLSENLFTGKEVFHPNSNFIIKAVDANAFLTDFSVLSSYDAGSGDVGYFGNIIIDYTTGSGMDFISGTTSAVTATTTKITNGDLIFKSGPSAFRLLNGNMTVTSSTKAIPYTIGGSFIVRNGFTSIITLRNTSYTAHFKVNKDFIMNGSATFRMTGAIITTAEDLYVDGNMKLNDTSKFLFSTNVNNSQPPLSLYLKGDIAVASGATFTNATTAVNNANLYFISNGDGTTDALTQTIDIAPTTGSNAKINFSIIWPTFPSVPYVKLTKHLYLGINSLVNVRANSSLDFGFNGTIANNILNASGATGTSFTQAANTDLYITSSQGIQTSGASGNVQTDTRNFATAIPYADYHFIGTAQSTGDALPVNVRDLVINNTDNTNEILLTNASLNVTRNLEVQKGIFNLNDKDVFGAASSALNIEGLATLKIAGTKTFPTGFTSIAFKPTSIVEYGGAEQSIAVTGETNYTNLPVYENLKISGTNIKSPATDLTVNNITTVTAGTLQINETADNIQPHVFTAKKGLQNTGGTVLLANNANLLQDVDAANVGNVTMERKATVPSTQYNYWSSPVKNQPLYGLYGALDMPDKTVKTYNTATDFFTNLLKSSNPTSLFGKGYSIKGPTNSTIAPYPITATFVGEPNNESTTPSENTTPLSTVGARYNLIGNPYPSNLNLVELYNANVGQFHIDGADTPTAYLWDNTGNTHLIQQGSEYANYATNNYATVNLSSGIGTSATSPTASVKKPNGIVRPGQGFIIKASAGATGLTFKNEDMRTSSIEMGGSNSEYFKNTSAPSNDNFWLTLTTPSNMNIVIAMSYNPNAENTFERFDSKVPNEAVTENFYSLSSDAKKLAIQSRKDFTTSDVVPLGIKSSKTEIQKISIDEKYGVFENQNIYLKDNLLNIVTNLSQGAYEFTAPIGINENRFEIVFEPSATLGTGATTKESLQVYRNGESFVVKSGQSKIDEVEVFDASGRLFQKVKGGSTEVKLDATVLPAGMYILKISRSNETISKKIIK